MFVVRFGIVGVFLVLGLFWSGFSNRVVCGSACGMCGLAVPAEEFAGQPEAVGATHEHLDEGSCCASTTAARDPASDRGDWSEMAASCDATTEACQLCCSVDIRGFAPLAAVLPVESLRLWLPRVVDLDDGLVIFQRALAAPRAGELFAARRPVEWQFQTEAQTPLYSWRTVFLRL